MKLKLDQIKINPLHDKIYSSNDVDDLVESMNKDGLLEPIIISPDKVIISGHRRYLAAKFLGWKDFEVVERPVENDEIEYLLISANQYRHKKNSEIINEINRLYEYYGRHRGQRNDLTLGHPNQSYQTHTREKIAKLLGISATHINKVINIQNNKPEFLALIDKDEMTINFANRLTNRIKKVTSSNKMPDIKLSSSLSDNCKIYNKSSHNMSELPDSSIQCIFTSPPYFFKRSYGNGKDEIGMEKTPEEYIARVVQHMTDCWRVLKTEGSFFLNLGDSFLNGSLQSIPHQIVLRLMDYGWIIRNTIIWQKINPYPTATTNNLTPSYEFVFHLVKDLKYYYDPVRVPNVYIKRVTYPFHKGTSDKAPTNISPYYPIMDDKKLNDFWNNDIVKTVVAQQHFGELLEHVEHPAPFPKELVILPLIMTTKPGDWVLDNFMGSGTTGEVSLGLNRKFVGYDINKEYCKLSTIRLSRILKSISKEKAA